MERPFVVPLSSPSATVIGIVPPLRPTGQRPSTCVPPSSSWDNERQDASEGHAQDKAAASAAAVSNVVPLVSSVVVQALMISTSTWVGATRVCGGG